MRAERFELMARLAQLPSDSVFFTQITMEAAEARGGTGSAAARRRLNQSDRSNASAAPAIRKGDNNSRGSARRNRLRKDMSAGGEIGTEANLASQLDPAGAAVILQLLLEVESLVRELLQTARLFFQLVSPGGTGFEILLGPV